MRALPLLVLLGCGAESVGGGGGGEAGGGRVRAPQSPRCTRTLAEDVPHQGTPWPHRIQWLADDRIVVLATEGEGNARSNGTAYDADRTAIVLFDVEHELRTGERPLASYVLRANLFAVRDPRTLILVTPTGAATLDLITGCLRESEHVEPIIDHLNETPLAAIDAVHGRVFLATEAAFIGIDVQTMQASEAARVGRDVEALEYDPTSDRIVARTGAATVRLYDPATLAELSTFDLPKAASGGPWIRPGHAEAAFSYELQCTRYEKPRNQAGMRGPRCLDSLPRSAHASFAWRCRRGPRSRPTRPVLRTTRSLSRANGRAGAAMGRRSSPTTRFRER